MSNLKYVLLPLLVVLALPLAASPRGDERAVAERTRLQSALPGYLTNEYAYTSNWRSGLPLFALPVLAKPWFKNEDYYALKSKVGEAVAVEKSCANSLELGKHQINFAALSDDRTSLTDLTKAVELLKSKQAILDKCRADLAPIIQAIIGLDAIYMKSQSSSFATAFSDARTTLERETASIAEYVRFEEAQVQIEQASSDRLTDTIVDDFVSVSDEGQDPAVIPVVAHHSEVALMPVSAEGVQVVAEVVASSDHSNVSQIERLDQLQSACDQLEEQLAQVALTSGAQTQAEHEQRLEVERALREQIIAQQEEIVTQRREIVALMTTQLGQREAQVQANKKYEERLQKAEANAKRLNRLFVATGITTAAILAYSNPETIVHAGEVLYQQVLPAASSVAVQGYNLAAPLVVDFGQAIWGMLPNSTAMVEAGQIGWQTAQPYLSTALSAGGNVTSTLITGARAYAGI